MTASATACPADDRALLLSWSRGRDEAAFTQFVQRHLGMVQGAALRKTARPELAEEVAQAVFALAARRAASLAEHPCAGAWLHRTAVLESANALRRELKHRKIAAAMLTQPDTSPEPALPHAALPHLDDALNSLPEHDRRAVLLRFGEKLSYDQMAARMGKSADACQKQTSRALERLRGVLSRRVAAVTTTALAAGLVSSLNSPASAAAGKVTAAAIAAAPKISFAAILHHLLNTMSTGKQIAAAAGIATLFASVPLGLSLSEAASLRSQLASQPPATMAVPAAKSPVVASSAFGPPGSRIVPGVGSAEADRTLTMLRGLRGKMLTSAQLLEVAGQLMALPASHLPKALEAMADFPGLLPAGLLRAMVFARWGEMDPEAGIAALTGGKLDFMTAEVARTALASGWLERDPMGLTAWLKENAKSPMAGALASMISVSGVLTRFDRETIQQLYNVVPSGSYPGALELEYECEAEDGDVAGVAHKLLAKAPDDHRRDELARAAAMHIARADPKAALEFVLAHPDPRGKISEFALSGTIGTWAEKDMNAAAAWAWERKGGDVTPSIEVWKALATKSEAEIQALLAKAPDEAARIQALELTVVQTSGDQEKSMRLMGQLPDGPRQRAMEQYSVIQAAHSMMKTSEWLLTLPEGQDKDAAIRGFAPVLANKEPDSAVIWAASIQDKTGRSELVRQLGSQWFQKAPEAAQAWLEQNETLTDADRAAITGKN